MRQITKTVADDELLLKEWNIERNAQNGIFPEKTAYKSNKKVWWKCSKGHEWEATVINRVNLGRGCPYCSHQKPIKGENDLATEHPELVKEWIVEKNLPLTPQDVTSGSKRMIWWSCNKKHEYKAIIKSRTSREGGCPYCANKKVLAGFNDLKTMKPEIAKQWHPYKNGKLTPEEVSFGSGKKVWWICPQGHEYQSKIDNRVKGRGCPICSKRRRTSFSEQAIFYYIRQIYPDAINSYKEWLDKKMELDIYIPSKKVGIEFDGKVFHAKVENMERDSRKYEECKKQGIKLIRIREINHHTDWFMNYDYKIDIPNGNKIEYLEYAIKSLLVMFGKSYDNVNIKRDRNDILEYLAAIDGKSFETEFPAIAAQWHPTKNGNLKPSMFTSGDSNKFWWKCPYCGEDWQTSIYERTIRGLETCPECSMKQAGKKNIATRISEHGSLAQNRPLLMEEWDYDKNEIDPNKITSGSSQKVWWKCSVCGYSWSATISHRTNGRGCPKCKGKKISGKMKNRNEKIAKQLYLDFSNEAK